jgi:DNA-nicking Smr family endonuclease
MSGGAFDPRTMLGRGGFDTHATLDLRGLKREEALAKLQALIATHAAPAPHRYAVLIDPAIPGGAETLFQPVGRYLLDAKRAGKIFAVTPLADPPGGGFAIDLGQA